MLYMGGRRSLIIKTVENLHIHGAGGVERAVQWPACSQDPLCIKKLWLWVKMISFR